MSVLEVLNSPWAIVPDKLAEIRDIYLSHARGEKADFAAIEAAIGRPLNNERKPYAVVNDVAIVPVEGVIAKKANVFMRISGGTSTQVLRQNLQAALDDTSVRAIILAVDSPGGTVDGTQEIAQFIFAARQQKPIVTYSDGVMASGGYWIGAAAQRVYINGDTAMVGSIGVVATHTDLSGYEAKAGVKTTEITAGKYKRIDSQYAPLTQEGRNYIQAQADYLYSVFVNDVAVFRGKDPETVIAEMADGRIFIGQQAVDAGLVDGKISLDALIESMAKGEMPTGDQLDNKIAAATAATEKMMAIDLKTATKEQVAAERPDLVEVFRASGAAAAASDNNKAVEQARAAGVTEGASGERARIQAVESQALPGHDALIATLKFDGKTTGPEAAVAVLSAEKEKLAKVRTQQHTDAPKPAPNANAPDPTPGADADASLPIAERAKKQWEADAKLRTEFGTYEAYLGFATANDQGLIKVLHKK